MRVVTLRHGRAVEIGGAVVHVTYARRGETRLAIDAPRAIPIRIVPRGEDARGQGTLALLPERDENGDEVPWVDADAMVDPWLCTPQLPECANCRRGLGQDEPCPTPDGPVVAPDCSSDDLPF